MFAEAGHFALILATAVAVVQATAPLYGAHKNDARLMAVCRPAAVAQFLLVGFSFGCLTHAYVTSDFSLVNVASNSHSMKPTIYKISGVWANHEGSMMLWVLILTIFGCSVAFFGSQLPPALRARALAVQSMIAVGFYSFILLTSNPFERIFPAPNDGRGLNPLLQDPGLALHPPMLYLGYVGMSMAFSFAVAALIEGRVDAAWARWVRPWTLAAWGFLTVGIALGSWWAYYELGWGGWWFWDPVENASFMPWLAGTALLHSSIVVEKRDALKGWTVFLAILAFGFSLLGTFLVRSGVLTSVHAFATDPQRGVFILGLLVATIGCALALFAVRGPSLRGGGLFQPISREGALLLNNLLTTVAAAAILLGTLYPVIIDAVSRGQDKISVGPPFFNAVFIPLMAPMVFAMAIGPFLAWKRGDLAAAMKRLWAAGASAVAAAAAVWAIMSDVSILGLLGMCMATWLLVGTVAELAQRIGLGRGSIGDSLRRLVALPRSGWGMTLAHAGMAVAIAGMTGAGVWKMESIQVQKPGDIVTMAGYDYRFDGATDARGPNYVARRGVFTILRNGEARHTLVAEKRRYIVERRETTEAAIEITPLGDIYAVIGDPAADGGYVTRLYFNPLVVWMWIGCAIMVLGACVSLTDRRYRIGAPRRAKTVGKVSARAAPAE